MLYWQQHGAGNKKHWGANYIVKSDYMVNIYIIYPKLCPIYIIQFCTDTITPSKFTFGVYTFLQVLLDTPVYIFIRILLACTIYISLFSFTKSQSHLYYVIPI